MIATNLDSANCLVLSVGPVVALGLMATARLSIAQRVGSVRSVGAVQEMIRATNARFPCPQWY